MIEHRKIASGVLAIAKDTGRILLARRAFKSHEPNCWGIFGGTFEEKDVSPKVTAKREFYEETKYKGNFTISKQPIFIKNTNHLVFYTFAGIFKSEFIPDVNGIDEFSKEHLDYGWFSLDELLNFEDLNLIDGLQDCLEEKEDVIRNMINFYC